MTFTSEKIDQLNCKFWYIIFKNIISTPLLIQISYPGDVQYKIMNYDEFRDSTNFQIFLTSGDVYRYYTRKNIMN